MNTLPAFFAAALAVLFSPALPSRAHGPHEHGAARMNLAVEGDSVVIALESPLANFLSFEHAPETDQQKEDARALIARLRKAEDLFRLSGAAGCRLEKVELEAEALEDFIREPSAQEAVHKAGDHPEHGEEGEEHGDLDAEFSFRCSRPADLHSLEVALFSVWPALRDIDVQMVTPAGQGSAELTPEQTLIRW
ncbi:MAG: DUF2796 domain-containing protein [Desulfovibrio sp.]|jgi:hypothetical protein|nr:DUF2796 domain-containing protein [Desulfovibrio sp.]